MLNILIVEPHPPRRADLVDWACELPGIVVTGAATSLAEAQALLVAKPIDVIVRGQLSLWDLTALGAIGDQLGVQIVEARGTQTELAAALTACVAHRRGPRGQQLHLSKQLAFEREARHASALGLAHRLRVAGQQLEHEQMQDIDLREWLPETIRRLRDLVPDYIELVAFVAVDTAPVRCVPAVLEHVTVDLVLEACLQLPWGGTVWLTAAPGADGEVKLDVLENGRGHILDLSLRATASAGS